MLGSDVLLELIKQAPAVAALLVVIILQAKMGNKREDTLRRFIDKTGEDISRQTKLITLLEVLVKK